MKILGISDSSVCGGATVSVDGEVVASLNEERLDRQKLSTGFPRQAIAEVLRLANLAPGDIDRIQAADNHNYFKPELPALREIGEDQLAPVHSKTYVFTISCSACARICPSSTSAI